MDVENNRAKIAAYFTLAITARPCSVSGAVDGFQEATIIFSTYFVQKTKFLHGQYGMKCI
jgi:hypothetical protein